MAGLFNTDLAELQAKIRGENTAERTAFLQNAAPSSLFAPVVQGAYGLIQQTRDTLSPDPRMQKAQALEAIKQEASKTTQPGTAEHYMKLAELSQAQGFADAAEYAMLKAQELEVAKESSLMKKEEFKMKQEELELKKQEALRKNRPSVGSEAELVAQGLNYPSFAEAPAEVKKKIMQQITSKQKPDTIGQMVSLLRDVIGQNRAETLGKEQAKSIAEQREKAGFAVQAQQAVGEALDLIDKGIYSGFWGKNVEEPLAKYTGGMIGSNEKLSRTQQYRAFIGNVVIPRLQEFGGNDSNEELKYLQSVMGAETELNEKSLKSILQSVERAIQRDLDRLRANEAAAQSGAPLPPIGGTLKIVEWDSM